MMKKLIIGMLALVSVVMMSCSDDDGYSLGDYWIGFGILKVESNTYRIYLDDGSLLKPVSWNIPPWEDEEWTDGSRILVNFTILEDETNENGDVESYLVKVNEAQKILMKGVLDITEENADSIGNDPIVVQDYWMTDSLINFKLRYRGYYQVHFLNLVQDPDDPTTENEAVKLELRHNANDDEESIPYTAYVSFSLNRFREAGKDSITFEVTSTDYDGVTHTFEEVFDYSDLELPNQ